MLKKRVIPVLLLKNGRMVKGKQFDRHIDTGSPSTAVRIYSSQDADELVFLDINSKRGVSENLLKIVDDASKEAFMPLTVGGGIRDVADVRKLLLVGADKVVITTAAYNNPNLIRECAFAFGNQCIVGGIDYKIEPQGPRVYLEAGTQATSISPLEHAQNLVSLGVGEIFINSIDRDGMMSGLDLSIIKDITEAVGVPVIAAGGVGNFSHIVEAFQKTEVSAVACSSIFHFGDNNPIRARSYLRNHNIPMRTLK